jgi:hypothetical protein
MKLTHIIGTLLPTSTTALAGDAYITVPKEATAGAVDGIAGPEPVIRDTFAIDDAIHATATRYSKVLLDGWDEPSITIADDGLPCWMVPVNFRGDGVPRHAVLYWRDGKVLGARLQID